VATPLSILQQYWKHSHFRPLQEEIITSVLVGKDTLAVLPTGGGKSVCFQVPALLMDGICIVVSPLIALMKDQVEQLKHKGILAAAVHSGMSRSEIDVYLNNALYGGIKFLYVSPERIRTDIFRERVRQMKVAMLAVDEAHCISQWGYDFRPAYLTIVELREWLPAVPVLALTASATPNVQQDITEKLHFKKGHALFIKSFVRENVSLVVRKTESKDRKLLEIVRKVPGSAIVYVRSRKATQEVAQWLIKNNLSAAYYHAGLTHEERNQAQEEWIKNKVRIMVATNAFGMGIDKPDVRLVVHLDLPENMESYYQEAGRAGRDGVRAYATILYQEVDAITLQTRVEQSQPSMEQLQQVYQALCSYFQLAMGSGAGESYDFDLHDFCERFSLPVTLTFNALKKLEENDLIAFNESYYAPSRVHIPIDKTKLYEFQIAYEKFDPFIKMMLRLYGGELFSDYVTIAESYLAKAMKSSVEEIKTQLRHLHQLHVVSYQPQNDNPQVVFVIPRQESKYLPINRKLLAERRELVINNMKSMLMYASNEHRCRMQLIQEYFGEELASPCGKCDVCINKRKQANTQTVEELKEQIMRLTREQPISIDELEERLGNGDSELFVEVVRELVDRGDVYYDEAWRLRAKV
jgi:ATP-dependent DNA helicase RecQ